MYQKLKVKVRNQLVVHDTQMCCDTMVKNHWSNPVIPNRGDEAHQGAAKFGVTAFFDVLSSRVPKFFIFNQVLRDAAKLFRHLKGSVNKKRLKNSGFIISDSFNWSFRGQIFPVEKCRHDLWARDNIVDNRKLG